MSYIEDLIKRRTNEFRILIREAKYGRMWIWEEGTKNWYTPEEFEENMLQDKTIKFYETTIFRIADPILALKQADDSIEASRKRREEFSLKILRYYQQLK